jgi:acyl-CoA thioesterase-1
MSIVPPFVPRIRPWWAIVLPFLIFGCGDAESNQPRSAGRPSAGAEGESSSAADRRIVMFLGTSLTDGYGLEREDAYPALVQEKIDSAGLAWEVVNAGLSGEKSAGALQRVRSWLIKQPFDVLVIETGANDMLTGADLDTMRANIQGIIDTVRAARPTAHVVLAGMLAAPNLGESYVRRFNATYPALARENRLTFIPFILEGVAAQPELNLADGIHPNEQGHQRVAATVWHTLEPILRAPAGAGAAETSTGSADSVPGG